MTGDYPQKLREAMEGQGHRVRSLAARAGIPDEDLWDYLQGRAVPDPEAAKRIASALRLGPGALPPPERSTPSPSDPGTSLRPRADDLGFPILRPPILAHLAGADPAWRRREVTRIHRRQKAVIRLLIDKGIFTRAEWEAKLEKVIARRPRTRRKR